MTGNLYRDSLSNMIGNVGEARHEQVGTGSERIAAPAPAGGAAPAAWSAAGRSRAAGQRDAHNGVAVERTAASRWHGGAQEPHTGSTLWARRGAAARVDAGPDGRRARGRLCYGSMDVAARGRVD